jgi:flagellar hook-associated protein 2
LAWAGQGSGSIEVELTQGIADQLFNALDIALDEFDGPVAQSIEDLKASNETYRQQIAAIDQRAETARTRLIERFSAMEAALSLANAMLEQVRAQVDAMTAKS